MKPLICSTFTAVQEMRPMKSNWKWQPIHEIMIYHLKGIGKQMKN